jgi:hypothetical protein
MGQIQQFIFAVLVTYTHLPFQALHVTTVVRETHSYSISNIIDEGRCHCVSRSYQNFQNVAVSSKLTDGRRGGESLNKLKWTLIKDRYYKLYYNVLSP